MRCNKDAVAAGRENREHCCAYEAVKRPTINRSVSADQHDTIVGNIEHYISALTPFPVTK